MNLPSLTAPGALAMFGGVPTTVAGVVMAYTGFSGLAGFPNVGSQFVQRKAAGLNGADRLAIRYESLRHRNSKRGWNPCSYARSGSDAERLANL